MTCFLKVLLTVSDRAMYENFCPLGIPPEKGTT